MVLAEPQHQLDDQLFEQAKGQCGKGAAAVGYTAEGGMYFAASITDPARLVFLLDLMRHAVISEAIGGDDD